MVLAEFRFAFLPERGTVAGGLGVHPVFGQPGNYVPSGLLTYFLQFTTNRKAENGTVWCGLSVQVLCQWIEVVRNMKVILTKRNIHIDAFFQIKWQVYL